MTTSYNSSLAKTDSELTAKTFLWEDELLWIANKGWKKAMKENKEIRLGANVVDGKVAYQAVSEAFGLEYTPIDSFLN